MAAGIADSAVRTWVKGQKLHVWQTHHIARGFFIAVHFLWKWWCRLFICGGKKATSWFEWAYFSVEGNEGSWHCVSEKKFQASPLNGAPLEPVSPTIPHLEIIVYNENGSLTILLHWAELNEVKANGCVSSSHMFTLSPSADFPVFLGLPYEFHTGFRKCTLATSRLMDIKVGVTRPSPRAAQ